MAVKFFVGTEAEAAVLTDAEMGRHAALPPNPYIVKLLDVCLFQWRLSPHYIGLVFEHFDTDLRKFLDIVQVKVAGMRHVLRSVLAALSFMHGHGLIHADCQPGSILLRGARAFQVGWLQLLEASRMAASASGFAPTGGGASLNAPPEVTYHLPSFFEVRAVVLSLRTHARYCIRTDVSPNDGLKRWSNDGFELSFQRPIRNKGMSKWPSNVYPKPEKL